MKNTQVGKMQRKLWDAVMQITPIIDVFKGEPINTQEYDLDHFYSTLICDEWWTLESHADGFHLSQEK